MQVLYQAELHPDNATNNITHHNKTQLFFITEYMHIAHKLSKMYDLFVRTNLTIKPKGTKMSKHDDKQCKCKNCGNMDKTNCDKKSGGKEKK